MITAKAPGKLYIAGEYAVVENGYPAILVALNQFVTCSIEASDLTTGTIKSAQYPTDTLTWWHEAEQINVDQSDHPFAYILSAMQIVEEYAQAIDYPVATYNLAIDSQLDAKNGKKYGLGSSAAVTVATVKALCEFYELPVDLLAIFKLASIAHFAVQGNGSLGDVAAAVYGGWLAYHSFDRQWLANRRQDTDLATLLDLNWPGLAIEPLTAPANLQLLIGWTGSPASTSKLVAKIAHFKEKQQTEYRQFLADSKACLHRMINAFHDANLDLIKQEIRFNRQLLQKLALKSGVDIETPRLKHLCQVAEQFGGAAKTSGAGGGDCGIVAIDSNADVYSLIEHWQANAIQPLPLTVHFVESLPQSLVTN